MIRPFIRVVQRVFTLRNLTIYLGLSAAFSGASPTHPSRSHGKAKGTSILSPKTHEFSKKAVNKHDTTYVPKPSQSTSFKIPSRIEARDPEFKYLTLNALHEFSKADQSMALADRIWNIDTYDHSSLNPEKKVQLEIERSIVEKNIFQSSELYYRRYRVYSNGLNSLYQSHAEAVKFCLSKLEQEIRLSFSIVRMHAFYLQIITENKLNINMRLLQKNILEADDHVLSNFETHRTTFKLYDLIDFINKRPLQFFDNLPASIAIYREEGFLNLLESYKFISSGERSKLKKIADDQEYLSKIYNLLKTKYTFSDALGFLESDRVDKIVSSIEYVEKYKDKIQPYTHSKDDTKESLFRSIYNMISSVYNDTKKEESKENESNIIKTSLQLVFNSIFNWGTVFFLSLYVVYEWFKKEKKPKKKQEISSELNEILEIIRERELKLLRFETSITENVQEEGDYYLYDGHYIPKKLFNEKMKEVIEICKCEEKLARVDIHLQDFWKSVSKLCMKKKVMNELTSYEQRVSRFKEANYHASFKELIKKAEEHQKLFEENLSSFKECWSLMREVRRSEGVAFTKSIDHKIDKGENPYNSLHKEFVALEKEPLRLFQKFEEVYSEYSLMLDDYEVALENYKKTTTLNNLDGQGYEKLHTAIINTASELEKKKDSLQRFEKIISEFKESLSTSRQLNGKLERLHDEYVESMIRPFQKKAVPEKFRQYQKSVIEKKAAKSQKEAIEGLSDLQKELEALNHRLEFKKFQKREDMQSKESASHQRKTHPKTTSVIDHPYKKLLLHGFAQAADALAVLKNIPTVKDSKQAKWLFIRSVGIITEALNRGAYCYRYSHLTHGNSSRESSALYRCRQLMVHYPHLVSSLSDDEIRGYANQLAHSLDMLIAHLSQEKPYVGEHITFSGASDIIKIFETLHMDCFSNRTSSPSPEIYFDWIKSLIGTIHTIRDSQIDDTMRAYMLDGLYLQAGEYASQLYKMGSPIFRQHAKAMRSLKAYRDDAAHIDLHWTTKKALDNPPLLPELDVPNILSDSALSNIRTHQEGIHV